MFDFIKPLGIQYVREFMISIRCQLNQLVSKIFCELIQSTFSQDMTDNSISYV